MKTTQPPRSFQPPGLRELLVEAGKWPEGKMRSKRIDALTQEDAMRAAWPA